MTDAPAPGSGHDTLHGRSRPDSTWTTTNVGEAVPGVQTPLGWSMWGPCGERALRRTFQLIGVVSKEEAQLPENSEDLLWSLFYGRIAMHLDILCAWADRIPGTSGEAMSTQIFTYVPPAYESRPARRYYPRVAARAGLPWIQGPRRLRQSRRRMAAFWEQSVREVGTLDGEGARRLLLRSEREFDTVIFHHTLVTLAVVQPAYDMLEKVCKGTETSCQELMGGHGNHEETAFLADLWECSRDRMTLERFLALYGYHGPQEGNVFSVVWREDPRPVERLLDAYRAKVDRTGPTALEREQIRRRREIEIRFLASLPRRRRPAARVALAVGERCIPLRGVGKVAFLQGVDVTRAAARRLGEVKAREGALDDADDVFFLTLDDVRGDWPSDAAALARERRSFYERYLELDVPELFQGVPVPVTVGQAPEAASRLDGVGASPGIVEGTARVILDPSDAHVEEGEILVARNTDPAWASLMFLSAGLISDIGGLMSHTAVVARELGLPCVVNTRAATKLLRTGDRIRLDGARGTVDILHAPSEPVRELRGVSDSRN